LGVVEEGAVVGIGLRRGDGHLIGLGGRGGRRNPAGQVAAAAIELAAKLGDQSCRAFVVCAIECSASHH
jgi:hypothetical protein